MEFIGGPGFKVDSKPPLPHPQPKQNCYAPQPDSEVNNKRGVKEEEEEPPSPLPPRRTLGATNSTDNYVGSRSILPAAVHKPAPQKCVSTGSDKSKT